MKKTILVFGLISGLIITTMMVVSIATYYDTNDFSHGELIGYSAMIVSFSFIFIGIKNFRDKHNGGIISFGKAFKVGFLITLISSTMYVVAWMIDYHFFIPDFMDRYTEYVVKDATADGATQAEIDEKVSEMTTFKELYKNPLMVLLITYAEILPIGVLISLISAWILKRKAREPNLSMAG